MRGNKNFKIYVLLMVMMGMILGTWTFKAEAVTAYPTKPITIVVPYPAGGAVDIPPRGIAPYLGKYLNTSIVIANVPGADGIIGNNKVYTAKADGYTLLASNTLAPIIAEFSRETKYKTLDFNPIFALTRDSLNLVVHPEGCKNFEEFVKTARTRTMVVGTTGRATVSGLGGIILEERLGLKVNWVPFSGGAESLTALSGKHIEAVVTFISAASSLVRAGKIKPLLVFSDKRHPKYPEVPVPNELGVDIPPLVGRVGIVGPPDMDEDKIRILEEAFEKAVKDPDYLEWLKKVATTEFIPLSSKEYRKEFERLYTVVEKYKKYLK